MRSLTYKKRFKLLCLTAASGSIHNLEFLLPLVGCVVTGKVLEAAAAAGQLGVCQWLRQQGCPWEEREYTNDETTAYAAGQANHRDVCEWLIVSGCPKAALTAAYGAADGGHVDLLEWLLPQGQPDARELLPRVAKGCDLATLQRLHPARMRDEGGAEEQGAAIPPEWNKHAVMAAATSSPTPDWCAKVEWLLESGYPPNEIGYAAAEQPDALERLAWLRARGFKPNIRAAAWEDGELPSCNAARHGHLDELRALHERGQAGRLDVVAETAAANGHLSVVAWVVEELGAVEVMTASLFSYAATSGSADVVVWLCERGCPWDLHAFPEAAEAGCEEALEAMARHGCPMEGDGDVRPCEAACEQSDLATLACLRRVGCPWDADVFTNVIADCPIPVLRWLVEHGCPIDWDQALYTAEWHYAERGWCTSRFPLSSVLDNITWLKAQKRTAAVGRD